MNDMAVTTAKKVTLSSMMRRHGSAFSCMRDSSGRLQVANQHTKALIPVGETDGMAASIKAHLRPCGIEAAGVLAAQFMTAFLKRDLHDPEGFRAMLAKVIAAHPHDLASKAVFSVASTSLYGPKIAAVNTELKKLTARRSDALAVVESHKREHERREAARKEEALHKADFDEQGRRIVSRERYKMMHDALLDMSNYVVQS